MSDRFRDHVFPICIYDTVQYTLVNTYGTGFFIGKNGLGLTVAHIFNQIDQEIQVNQKAAIMMVAEDLQWQVFDIIQINRHETEDVAIFKTVNTNQIYDSFFKLDTEFRQATTEYNAWGYPHAITKQTTYLADGNPLPDLTYTAGYIRRRVSRELPSVQFTGSKFFELSEMVSEGYSGSPVHLKGKPENTLGIYAGICDEARAGYAVRSESFLDWKPEILNGKTVLQESTST